MKGVMIFLNLFLILSVRGQSLGDALDKKDTITALQIIKKGYKLDSLDNFGSAILMSSCRYTDDAFSANFLLNHGAKPDYPKSPKGRTALIITCAY